MCSFAHAAFVFTSVCSPTGPATAVSNLRPGLSSVDRFTAAAVASCSFYIFVLQRVSILSVLACTQFSVTAVLHISSCVIMTSSTNMRRHRNAGSR